MKIRDIVAGGVYAGPRGTQKRVLRIAPDLVVYHNNPEAQAALCPPGTLCVETEYVGEANVRGGIPHTRLVSFARWARRRIPALETPRPRLTPNQKKPGHE